MRADGKVNEVHGSRSPPKGGVQSWGRCEKATAFHYLEILRKDFGRRVEVFCLLHEEVFCRGSTFPN